MEAEPKRKMTLRGCGSCASVLGIRPGWRAWMKVIPPMFIVGFLLIFVAMLVGLTGQVWLIGLTFQRSVTWESSW